MRRYLLVAVFSAFAVSIAMVGVLAWGQGEDASLGNRAVSCVGGFFGAGDRADTPGADAAIPVVNEGGAGSDAYVWNPGPLSFFTGGGTYMPRTHCMVNEAGQTDWPWVWALLGLNATVIAGYARIFIFWRRAYLNEAPKDRNNKLMDLAWIFLWCAVCGYASSIAVFIWPAYRLLALFLIPLAFFTWKFCANLSDMNVSLSAKRLERELNEALRARTDALEEEVRVRTTELQAARDAERAANESKSAFIATISHEIRTPLNAIMGYSALVAEPELEQETRDEYSGIIRRNGDHLATVINDVLDISKIESRKLAIDAVECELPVIVTDVVTLLSPTASEKGITISAELDGPIPASIMGDPTRIRQVLLNLASNAVKFTERGGVRVVVSAERHGPLCGITLRVIDTGIGMACDQVERVFEPFSQAEPGTTRRFGGTGLGLPISRSLAELMGGTVEAESAHGEGSVFTATIAARVPEGAAWIDTLRASEPARKQSAPIGALSGRVLIADDSIDNRRLFVMQLRKMGLECVEAEDGVVACETCFKAYDDAEPFDLVLMDIDMPRCDGETAMKRIRERHPGQVVVALTAHTMSTVRDRLLEAGFDDYASKPIRRDALQTLCAKWIGGRREAA